MTIGEREHIVVLEGHIAVLGDLVERLRSAVNNEDYMEITDLLDELDEELARAGDNIKIRREASS
jgi:hypothetical protein